MELMSSESRSRNYVLEPGSRSPWYKQKRNIAIMISLTLIPILVLICYFVYTSAYRHRRGEVGSEYFKTSKAFAPVKWDGVCPQKSSQCPSSFQGKPPLILVSLDGFRPDYLKRGKSPTLRNIAECGSTADFMYPVFPSKTFPNHYSQVTGLNPASHGIIDNSMYDPIRRKLFKVGQPESLQSFWWQKEPIWVTAEKQGIRTACFFWPGSDIKINNTLPTYYKKYNARIPFDDRVDQILKWLDLSAESRPRFMTLYVNEPDHAAHRYGTDSKQTNEAISKVDNMVARLFSGLQQRRLAGCVNVVIVSDHGMSNIDCGRVINVQDYINVSEAFSTMGAFGRIRPKGRFNKTAIRNMVDNMRCQSQHMRVYAKELLPVRMHYADNDRIEPIYLDIDAGWTVVSKGTKTGDGICSGGAHGYDNLFPEMRAIFMAHGPSFKHNTKTKPFINTELYEMFSELIGMAPNLNNGTKGSLHHIMVSPKPLPVQIEPDPPAVSTVPDDEKEYEFRLYAANCTCPSNHKQKDVEGMSEKRKLHLPFGVPYSSEDNSTLRLLYHDDFVSAFDLKYRIPMWSAFTLKGSNNVQELNEDPNCWKGDARIYISDTPKCNDYESTSLKKRYIFQRPLYPPGFSTSSNRDQASYLTNSIPKSLNHTKVIEKELIKLLNQWAGESSQLNVIIGPAFDLHATGVRPPIGRIMRLHEKGGPLIVPTHIFAIATWCSVKVESFEKCDSSKLEVNSFLLPNDPFPQNCKNPMEVIKKNVARVVDIENLTGISFFTRLSTYEAIRLRTAMPSRIFP